MRSYYCGSCLPTKKGEKPGLVLYESLILWWDIYKEPLHPCSDNRSSEFLRTLVELRKYENRRKAKDGHFLPRRHKKDGWLKHPGWSWMLKSGSDSFSLQIVERPWRTSTPETKQLPSRIVVDIASVPTSTKWYSCSGEGWPCQMLSHRVSYFTQAWFYHPNFSDLLFEVVLICSTHVYIVNIYLYTYIILHIFIHKGYRFWEYFAIKTQKKPVSVKFCLAGEWFLLFQAMSNHDCRLSRVKYNISAVMCRTKKSQKNIGFVIREPWFSAIRKGLFLLHVWTWKVQSNIEFPQEDSQGER